MEDKLIYVGKGIVLTLKYVDSVHPSEVHPKADHWKYIYKLYRDKIQLDEGLFTDNYYISNERKELIIEEYSITMDDIRKIKLDEDVILNLRLFDFQKQRTGKFSQITGGRFLVKNHEENKIVFQKVYDDKTIEYETQLGDIHLNNMDE